MADDGLRRWLEGRAPGLAPDAVRRLEALEGLWLRYGRAMNLSGARDAAGLRRHVADGLDVVRCAAAAGVPAGPTTRWLDVGSGAGFPGLVVAATSECAVTLVEPRERRAAFLRMALGVIERGSTRVIQARIECSTWDEMVVSGIFTVDSGRFTIASARAVMLPANWLELGINVVQPGGIVVVQRSSRVADEAEPALEHRQAELAATVEGELGRVEAYRTRSAP